MAMRANRDEKDPVKQTDMLKELVSKVSFLRMTTPKTYRDRCSSSLSRLSERVRSTIQCAQIVLSAVKPNINFYAGVLGMDL